MIFADELYADEKLSKSYRAVIRKIREDKVPLTWYLIARPQSGLFPFNIYPACLLKQKYYRELAETVVGVASSKEDAVALAGVLAVREKEAKSFPQETPSKSSADGPENPNA